MDLFRWDDKNEDLLFAQDAFLVRTACQHWKLRMMAREAPLKEVANSKLRRLSAQKNPFICTDAKIVKHNVCCDVCSALFSREADHNSTPCKRGPARIPDIDEPGVKAKFQSQTSKVAMNIVMGKWMRSMWVERNGILCR